MIIIKFSFTCYFSKELEHAARYKEGGDYGMGKTSTSTLEKPAKINTTIIPTQKHTAR